MAVAAASASEETEVNGRHAESPEAGPRTTSGVALLRRHQLVGWSAITVAISWGGILLLIGPGSVPVDAEHLAILIGLGYVAMLAGPTLATILMSAVLEVRVGLRSRWREFAHWKVGGRWWLTALLTAPITFVTVLVALSLAAPDYVPRLVVEDEPGALLQYVAVSALLTGVFEELGWTGFVTPALVPRHGVVRTGLIVGLMMAGWNALIVSVKELSIPTPGDLPIVVVIAAGLLTWQLPYRILMVWTYARTRSVLLAMAMQTSLVAAWTSLTPLTLSQSTLIVLYVVLAAIWGVMTWVVLRAPQGTQQKAVASAVGG